MDREYSKAEWGMMLERVWDQFDRRQFRNAHPGVWASTGRHKFIDQTWKFCLTVSSRWSCSPACQPHQGWPYLLYHLLRSSHIWYSVFSSRSTFKEGILQTTLQWWVPPLYQVQRRPILHLLGHILSLRIHQLMVFHLEQACFPFFQVPFLFWGGFSKPFLLGVSEWAIKALLWFPGAMKVHIHKDI